MAYTCHECRRGTFEEVGYHHAGSKGDRRGHCGRGIVEIKYGYAQEDARI